MPPLLTCERRLLATANLLDIALVLEDAGLDPRTFTPDELARLDATLLRRQTGRPPFNGA